VGFFFFFFFVFFFFGGVLGGGGVFFFLGGGVFFFVLGMESSSTCYDLANFERRAIEKNWFTAFEASSRWKRAASLCGRAGQGHVSVTRSGLRHPL